jgi:RNA polymerase sigma-70 factor, ECF subfamily
MVDMSNSWCQPANGPSAVCRPVNDRLRSGGLRAVLSVLPSAFSLASPVSLPTASFTALLACLPEPLTIFVHLVAFLISTACGAEKTPASTCVPEQLPGGHIVDSMRVSPDGGDLSTSIDDEILKCLPHLRAFARSLTGDRDQADDLVQDAVLRAIRAANQFTPGTNFKGWIFTILRNLYFNEFRRKRRGSMRPLEAGDREIHGTTPAQQARLEFDDFRHAFNMLPAEQREALVLVGADGNPYEDAAAICGCPVGTIKSRVARGRRELQRLLNIDSAELPSTDDVRARRLPRTATAHRKRGVDRS